MKFIQLGKKKRHLYYPEGFELVTTGICKKGDWFANLATFKWTRCEEDDIGMNATDFDFLLRQTNGKFDKTPNL